jgi:Tol biopolymer transport system component
MAMRTVACAALTACACARHAPTSCTPPRALAELNTPGEERSPYLSLDGSEIFFSSDRAGTPDLYRSTRSRGGIAFAAPELVAELSTPDAEYDPFLSDDGLDLYFWRASTAGIWRAHRAARGATFDAPTLDASLAGRHASLTGDGLAAYTASLHLTPTEDIFVATRATANDAFGAPTIVASAPPYNDQGPTISRDGSFLVFGTAALTTDGTIRVVRASVAADGTVGAPALVEELAPIAGGDDRDAARREATSPIVFASTRPGGAGGLDLWIACE